MPNTKYLILIVTFVIIVGMGIYITAHKPPATTNSQMQNREVAKSYHVATTAEDIDQKNEQVSTVPVPKNKRSPQLTTTEGVPVGVDHAQFPPEVDSVAGLLKISSNIFVGKVVKKIGDAPGHAVTSTRFEVETVENITGNVTMKVFVDQIGVGYGYGKFMVGEGDIGGIISNQINPNDIFLKTEATYLFAAHCEGNLCGIGAPPYDRELITTNPGLSKAEIMTAAHANARVQQFFDLANK